jgi:glyoxylase-like metal-dependent hydrolase (beta-lactamase superfamily II)
MSSAKNLNEILLDRNLSPENKWGFKSILTDDSLSYVVWNKDTNEGLVVDPVKESIQLTYDTIVAAGNIRWLIFDTHTHADHVSGAAELSKKIKAPLLMHEKAPSRRVDIRISRDISWPLTGEALQILLTPGHTSDALCLKWGPFLFTGDLILHGDTGRDDLPTGDPTSHFDSLEKIRKLIPKNTLILPGHDAEGGRVTSLETQLKINPSFNQSREEFIKESEAYEGAAPKKLKESLFENFK